jgi:predicted acetyltransferase
MPTYRPVPDDRIDEYRAIQRYAFSPAEPTEPVESVDELPRRATLGARHGLFDGEELLCTATHHWFTTTVRDGEHPLAGLAGVATPPENRRQGLIARLLRESLAEYREHDQYLSALWPFEYAFYRQYGWAQAGTTAIYECDPEALAFAAEIECDGEFQRLGPDDFTAMDPVLAAAGEGVSLWMRRSEEWWRDRIFTGRENDPYVYGVERDGDLRGYVVYHIDADDGRTMRVEECNAIDNAAFLDLLQFILYHDSQVDRVRIRGRVDWPLADLADDPRAIDCELVPGGMVRIVDVERALSALDYPAAAEGRVVLSVDDPIAAWNDDTFALAVRDGAATCTPVDESLDARIAITTLSQLFVGHFSVEHARMAGDLTVESDEVAARLAAMFPPRDVTLSEDF